MSEIVGIIASCFIISGFIAKDLRVVRTLNAIADIIFVVYGVLIGSLGIIILDTALAIVTISLIFKKDGYKNSIRILLIILFSLIAFAVPIIMNSQPIEYFAAVLNILMFIGFSSSRNITMRVFCMSSAIGYVFYAFTLSAWSLLFCNLLLSVVHIFRLSKIFIDNRKTVKQNG